MSADWFERITGFRESDYATVRRHLRVEDRWLVSDVNQKRYRIGQLEMPCPSELRDNITTGQRTTFSNVVGHVAALHRNLKLEGALFQVASQFNLLEMVSPGITPEHGVTRYRNDHTQGPACAIATGAATIYRNYFVPVGDRIGQTTLHQLDAPEPLAETLAETLSGRLGRSKGELWTMRNGYALCTQTGLTAISKLIGTCSESERETLKGRLQIGLHHDVEVTDVEVSDVQNPARRLVSQAFCSALPVACTDIPAPEWEPFARLVLEAAYETTLLAAVRMHRAGGSGIVLLTRLGGGAFGNKPEWIDRAIEQALHQVEYAGLDVRLVHFNSVPERMTSLQQHWNRANTGTR